VTVTFAAAEAPAPEAPPEPTLDELVCEVLGEMETACTRFGLRTWTVGNVRVRGESQLAAGGRIRSRTSIVWYLDGSQSNRQTVAMAVRAFIAKEPFRMPIMTQDYKQLMKDRERGIRPEVPFFDETESNRLQAEFAERMAVRRAELKGNPNGGVF
jgi:hypothetical protein